MGKQERKCSLFKNWHLRTGLALLVELYVLECVVCDSFALMSDLSLIVFKNALVVAVRKMHVDFFSWSDLSGSS